MGLYLGCLWILLYKLCAKYIMYNVNDKPVTLCLFKYKPICFLFCCFHLFSYYIHFILVISNTQTYPRTLIFLLLIFIYICIQYFIEMVKFETETPWKPTHKYGGKKQTCVMWIPMSPSMSGKPWKLNARNVFILILVTHLTMRAMFTNHANFRCL